MSKKKNVAVLMGGVSSEHEVSLSSGRGVVDALEGGQFQPVPVVITKEGAWTFGEDAPVSVFEAPQRLRQHGIACVFIALHGPNGEDGRMQGFLDTLGLPYTGSGCAASALAMDKLRCKAVVQAENIRAAAHVGFGQLTWAEDQDAIEELVDGDIGFPCVLKPPCQGSSVAIEIPDSIEAFRAGVPRVLEIEGVVMVEEFIKGTEVTCAVLDAAGPGNARALPLTEIRPKTAEFFDYEAKYTPGASEEITPAEIDDDVAAEVQAISLRVHHLVGCAGWSRSDFMIDDHGPVWIEVNTVPGLTETSLYPQACAAVGISYAQMAEMFVEAALGAG